MNKSAKKLIRYKGSRSSVVFIGELLKIVEVKSAEGITGVLYRVKRNSTILYVEEKDVVVPLRTKDVKKYVLTHSRVIDVLRTGDIINGTDTVSSIIKRNNSDTRIITVNSDTYANALKVEDIVTITTKEQLSQGAYKV